jgi:hypothetical protein
VELIRFVALLGVLPLIPAAYQLAVVLAVVVQLTLFGLLWRGKSLSVDQASPL